MFYPVDSLKRGGRFYLCWVADSWPLQFAAITHRQLWSSDIRDLCQDLLEVMTTESGRPSRRFSLRLSSQLLRGLVRLYEKKATVILSDICMINAHVFKTTNKKFTVIEVVERPQRPFQPLPLVPAAAEEPDYEQRVEELIQDGFGEENPDHQLQLLLGDRTIEMMMAQDASGAQQISGLDFAVEGDRSHDKSRLAHDAAQMEMAVDIDFTFRKYASVIPLPDLTVPDVPVPEIQVMEAQAQVEVPQDEAPQIVEKEVVPRKEVIPQKEVVPRKEAVPQKEVVPEREEIDTELEELEEQPQTRKRLVKPKLIIDKRIKIDQEVFRERIQDYKVELRCEIQERELIEAQTTQPRARREDSDGSETPLGSLDRTKVSLGESTQTTDSLRLIRNHWGIEGTMMKILQLARYSPDVTFTMLLGSGPIVAGQKRIIAAKCFTSILKLKQHGFVRVTTDPETRQIIFRLGPNFE